MRVLSKDENGEIKSIVQKCLEEKRKRSLARLEKKFNTDRVIEIFENASKQFEDNSKFIRECEEKISRFKKAASQLCAESQSKEELSLTNIIKDTVPLIKANLSYFIQVLPLSEEDNIKFFMLINLWRNGVEHARAELKLNKSHADVAFLYNNEIVMVECKRIPLKFGSFEQLTEYALHSDFIYEAVPYTVENEDGIRFF